MGRRKKYVDLFQVDRLSKLPRDIIYLILSFLDIKYVVQTTTLSKRWVHIWKSVTHLNFDSYKFHTMPQFTIFVNNVLSKRNSSSQVSAVELRFKGPATDVIKRIIHYAYLHSVEKLSFIWFTYKEHDFPPYLFTCHTLKHLTLAVYNRNMVAGICHLPKLLWDFPALETLNLRDVQFHECEYKSANLFSKCMNLKELTLHGFTMPPLETFNICAPQLSSLTIGNAYYFPKVLNVVAPQLKNLTASIQSSLQIQNGDYLQLSSVRFDSLEKVSLSKNDTRDYSYEKHVPRVLDLFEKLHSAKFLILDMNIIQVPQKRVQQQVHNQPTAKKRTKLDAENKQLETTDQEKKMLEVEMQRQNKVVAEQKARIQRQEGVIAEQNARIQRQDGVIAELKSKIEILKAAKVASSSSRPLIRSKRVDQPSKSSGE
ncbi:F-box domain, cyclin-like protein [Tanacetum coccineum]